MDERKKSSLKSSSLPQGAANRLRRMTSMSSSSSNGMKTSTNSRSFLQAKFRHDSHDDDESDPLVTHLDKYTAEELQEYRQVFNMFDADRSGAIGLDELENAITNLGVDSKTVDLESIIKEAD
uniref:EF-hand domain-containing protein n=1 Tax=Panagrolaimus sp. ES5 TaxID=591445 RepID=A0AC34G6L6_9BILA